MSLAFEYWLGFSTLLEFDGVVSLEEDDSFLTEDFKEGYFEDFTLYLISSSSRLRVF
jgi:hypothetical protein